MGVRPSHQWVVLRDALGLRERMAADVEHLRAAMAWLCRAQDAAAAASGIDRGGVSAGYYLASGWLPPYPETTGYIIETFLQYAAGGGGGGDTRYDHQTRGLASPARLSRSGRDAKADHAGCTGGTPVPHRVGSSTGETPAAAVRPVPHRLGNPTGQTPVPHQLGAGRYEPAPSSYIERAVCMGDWECAIQLPEGGVRGQIGINDYPIVFNTGQVMLGWLALHRHTGEQRYLDAAARAGDWLAGIQEPDGRWVRHSHNNIPHAYHARVAWPLLELAARTHDARHADAARRFITWVLGQVRPNGWIGHLGFVAEPWAYTHTIVYTMRGLLESSAFLEGDLQREARRVVTAMAEKLLILFELAKDDPRGRPRDLPGAFDEHWRPVGRYTCLTGNAQLAIVWLKLYRLTGDPRLVNGALKLIDQVKTTQRLGSRHPGIRGAVAGSYPLWGGYERFGYPNWAAKFLADAIMLQEQVMGELEEGPA